MIAENNETMVSAVETMYDKQADEMAREILRRKQDAIDYQRIMKERFSELERKNASLETANASLKTANESLEAENERLKKLLTENGVVG